MHRKDLLAKGYKSWAEKGTKLQMENVGKKLKKENKIKDYVIDKCMKGKNKDKYEIYVK